MICENCNAQINHEQALFCPKCGHKLVRPPRQTPPGSGDAHTAEPGKPEKEEEPKNAIEPKRAIEPEKAAERGKASKPVKSKRSVKTGKAEEPEKSKRPMKPKKAAESEKPEEWGKAAELENPVEREKAPEPERAVEPRKAAEPAETAKPVKYTDSGRQKQPEKAAGPAKRKDRKALVILLIVVFILAAGVPTTVFLLPHGERAEQMPPDGANSSNSQVQNTAALLPESPDPASEPHAALASSAPAPAIPSASEAQPDSQTQALDTSEEPGPVSEQPALGEPDPVPEQPVQEEPNPEEPASPPDDSEYVFPQSSSAYLTDADLAGLDKATLRLARNEICARHGKMFRDAELRAYFESKSWYSGTIEADAFDQLVNIYNEYEVANIALIQRYEAM